LTINGSDNKECISTLKKIGINYVILNLNLTYQFFQKMTLSNENSIENKLGDLFDIKISRLDLNDIKKVISKIIKIKNIESKEYYLSGPIAFTLQVKI
jgi:hypothetical protein